MLGRLTEIPRKLNCAPGVPVILIIQLGSFHPIHGNLFFPNFRIQSEAGACPKEDSLPPMGPRPVSDIRVSNGQTDS